MKIKNYIIFVLFLFIFNIFLNANPIRNYFPERLHPKNLKKLEITNNKIAISEKLYNYLYKKFNVPTQESEILVKIWSVAGPLINFLDLEYDDIDFKILNIDEKVLLSSPDGIIYISRGIFDLCKNDDELAFIIGRQLFFLLHELHIEINSNTKIRQNLKENIPIIDEYLISFNSLNSIKADKASSYYMFKTGHSPWNAHSFLQRLFEVETTKDSIFDVKDLKNRIEELERYINKAMPFSHIKTESNTSYRNAYYYFVLGNKFLKADLIEDAIKSYKQSISLKPKVAETHNNLGIAYSRKGFYNQACYHYDIAVKLNPYYSYYFNNAVCLIKLGKYHEALINLKSSINLKHDNEKAQKLLLSLESFVEEIKKYE